MDRMHDVQSGVSEIERWIAAQFPAAFVEKGEDFERETVLFRVKIQDNMASELELSREVLTDNSPASLVAALNQSDVAERLERDPSVRVQFFSSGIPHFETRWIECDGRTYRVVRDEKHNVTLYDAADRRLANMPPQMLVTDTSIFRGPAHEWGGQILQWRGLDQ
jgi:hypothetical protein